MTTDQEVDNSVEAEAVAPQAKEAAQAKDKAQSKEKEKSQSKLASTISQARLKLKPGLNYVLDGFPPVIAVIALVAAVFALNESRSLRAQLSTAVAKIESLSTSTGFASREDFDKVKASVEGIDKGKASIEELDKVKAVMAQEKITHEAELARQSERNTKIIQGVSKLQVKMKVSPTLEAQMREPVVVPVAAPAPSAAVKAAIAPVAAIVPTPVPVPAPAPVKIITPTPAPAPAQVKQIVLSKPEVPAAAKPAPVKPVAKTEAPAAKNAATIVTGDTKQQREVQVKSIKDQIDEFNKK